MHALALFLMSIRRHPLVGWVALFALSLIVGAAFGWAV